SLHRYVACLAHTAPVLPQALASATLELTIGRSRRACILDLSPIRGDRVIALRRQVRAIETGRPDTALGQMVSGFGCQVTRPFATASPASFHTYRCSFHPDEQPLKLCYSVAFFVGFDRHSPPDGSALWSFWTCWSDWGFWSYRSCWRCWRFWSCCNCWSCRTSWRLCNGWSLCSGCVSARRNRFAVKANLHAPVLFTP